MVIDPKEIKFSQLKLFCIDAVELCKRKCVAYLLLTAISYGAYLIFAEIPLMSAFYPLVVFTIGCLIARCADHNEHVIISIATTTLSQWVKVVSFFIGYFVILVSFLLLFLGLMALVGYIVQLIDPGAGAISDKPGFINNEENEPNLPSEEKSTASRYSSSILIVFGVCTGVMPVYHLLVMMMNPPIRVLLALTGKCMLINMFPLIFLMLISLFIDAIVYVADYAFIILLPFLSAFNYTIYRAIYTDNDRNKKVEEKATLQDEVFNGHEAKT